jgi:DivIVA domain-containing protein
MESKTTAPSFTVSLRGYDRLEVDEYLDSLAEALGQVELAEDRNRAMQAHVDRLNARIAELEQRISADVPRSGAVLGERIAIILRSAEEAAADTVTRAETRVAEMLGQAHDEVASAEDQARGAILRGEEQARRVEAAAKAEAAEIVAEAEGRASTRTRQIEQWAEQVISHTRAEEARLLSEQQEKREQGEEELGALAEQRNAVADVLTELRETLGQALGLVGPPASASPSPSPAPAVQMAELSAAGGDEADRGQDGGTEAGDEPATRPRPMPGMMDVVGDDPDEVPWPAAFNPVQTDSEGGAESGAEGADRTGEIEQLAGDASSDGSDEPDEGSEASAEPDEFDTKFDAWVNGSGEPQHFRHL